jgi:ribosomal protein L12E/L44/L45/RPP1/RPP2
MKHVAAYLLLVVGGNASPSVEEVSSVVTACGGEADSAQIEALIAGKDSPTSKIISLFFIFLPCSAAAAALVIRFRRKER